MVAWQTGPGPQQQLEDLIAGLLDNSTGGLNGSLVPVTSELPTLGLNPVVWAALANATWSSSGTFGDPVSLAISTFVALPGGAVVPDFDFFGVLTSTWNTVSGAVMTGVAYIVHGVEGLFATAWNAAVAVVTYLVQIGKALVRFAETAVSATVAALKAVGGVLVKALGALLTLIKSEVTTLFSEAFRPIIQAIENYASDLVSALSAIEDGGTGDAAVRAFWEDAGGEVFLALLGLATVVMIAITIVSVMSLGAGFLASDIAGILITAAIIAVVAVSSSFIGGLSSWGTAAIDALETFFNKPPTDTASALSAVSVPSLISAPRGNSCSWQGSWDAFATVYGSLTDVFSGLTLGPGLLAGVLFAQLPGLNQNDVTGRIVDLAAGVLGVMVDFVGLGAQLHGQNALALFLSIWGVLLGAGGIIVDTILETHELPGAWRILDTMSDILDFSSVGIGGGTIAADIGICGGP